MLSYLEHYSADYFLLENVEGLLTYPLMSTQGSSGRTLEGGIQAGVVKFIMRTLIALGCVKSPLTFITHNSEPVPQVPSPLRAPPSRAVRCATGAQPRYILGGEARACAP